MGMPNATKLVWAPLLLSLAIPASGCQIAAIPFEFAARGIKRGPEQDLVLQFTEDLHDAECGDWRSQWSVAAGYESGVGTDKDLVQSLKWYMIISATQELDQDNSRILSANLDRTISGLDAEEVTRAGLLAAKWAPRNCDEEPKPTVDDLLRWIEDNNREFRYRVNVFWKHANGDTSGQTLRIVSHEVVGTRGDHFLLKLALRRGPGRRLDETFVVAFDYGGVRFVEVRKGTV